jgi:iron(III) transport system ATP-binding protein
MSGVATPAVEFRAVTKRYGAVTAVETVSLSIARGTLVTVLGPSGCGKTTVLRLIAGLEQASDGRILIGGDDVTLLSAAERDVSMVFQSYALFPHMTVLENVCYGLRASRVRRTQAVERAQAKLAQVGLAGYGARLPSELSGGQQQRVAVARAIVLEPKVLLFDEPLSNLDAKLRRRVREEIRELQQTLSLTAVYVTHDQQEALAISDRIMVMTMARIAQDGTPRALYEQPVSHFVADFIGDANIVPAVIERRDRDMACVRLGPLVLTLAHRGAAEGAAELSVRPQALLLGPDMAADDALHGRISRAAYLGSHMEYWVVADGLARELFVIAPDIDGAFPPGAHVTIRLAPSGVTVVPQKEASAGQT